MELLKVKGLCKRYKGFALDDVSFALEPGYIMGFIGRNGAGKTTTIKAMLGLIKKDGGEVEICGIPFDGNEKECKRRIGLVTGGFDCYKKSTLKTLTSVTRRFYDNWDDDLYSGYMKRFKLDENKRICELSTGMRIKYAITLALCHNAELLIFDEPTSGLDPVSRDDLLDLFRLIVSDGKRSILFSTHIISDLEKCADYITYIKNGRILSTKDVVTFCGDYLLVFGENERFEEKKRYFIGSKSNAFGFTALIHARDKDAFGDCKTAPADLESIMIYTEQEDM